MLQKGRRERWEAHHNIHDSMDIPNIKEWNKVETQYVEKDRSNTIVVMFISDKINLRAKDY